MSGHGRGETAATPWPTTGRLPIGGGGGGGAPSGVTSVFPYGSASVVAGGGGGGGGAGGIAGYTQRASGGYGGPDPGADGGVGGTGPGAGSGGVLGQFPPASVPGTGTGRSLGGSRVDDRSNRRCGSRRGCRWGSNDRLGVGATRGATEKAVGAAAPGGRTLCSSPSSQGPSVSNVELRHGPGWAWQRDHQLDDGPAAEP